MTDERTYHDSGDVLNPYADSGDYTWDDDDWPDDSLTPDDYTLLLERRLYEREQERDTVSAMTVAVYCLFAAGSFAAGWLLRGAWFW